MYSAVSVNPTTPRRMPEADGDAKVRRTPQLASLALASPVEAAEVIPTKSCQSVEAPVDEPGKARCVLGASADGVAGPMSTTTACRMRELVEFLAGVGGCAG